ncbi:hypothetical protein JYT61_00275 [bacterium AH-315-E10]|nr:hypothetical protein [bacterium AH-315-E10]
MKRKEFNWVLPEAIENRLGPNTYGRQRVLHEGDDLLIILHDVPNADQHDREHCVFWRDGSAHLFYNGGDNGEYKLRALMERYDKRYEELEELYDNATDSQILFHLIEELIPINRACNNMTTTLQKARECVRDDLFLIEMRDFSSQLQQNYEILLSDSKTALDYRIAKYAEEQTIQGKEAVDAQHRLNILAAVFFPLTTIATIFGMNLKHGLSERSVLVFWLVFIIGISVGIWTKGWIVRKENNG